MSRASGDIRSIGRDDLESITSILKSSLPLDDDLTIELVQFRIFDDPNFDADLSLAKIRDGRIASFVCATNPKISGESSDVAWIKVFATEEKYRKKGFESELFNHLFGVLRSRGVSEVRFSDLGNWHFWPGVDLNYEDALDFLTEMGFKKDAEYVDYYYDVSRFSYPRRISRLKEQLEKEGVKFSSLGKEEERMKVLEWIEKDFSFFWRNETEFALKNLEPSVFIAAEKTGEILGFATINGVAPSRFGPMGVRTDQRKRGIGTVLLFDSFQALKDQKYTRAAVHWTHHLFFYTQVPGLSGVRDYWVMSRRL